MFRLPLLSFCLTWSIVAIAMPSSDCAQEPNYDENQIPDYTLPDPLIMADGTPVTTAGQWPDRRAEIASLFREQVYGAMPDPERQAVAITATTTREAKVTLPLGDPATEPGQVDAVLREILLRVSRSDRPAMHRVARPPSDDGIDDTDPAVLTWRLLIVQPVGEVKAPAFLAYNFNGNHSLASSPEITLAPVWDRKSRKRTTPNDASRGERARRWPIGTLVDRGYALVTLHYGDVDPDFHDQFQNGAHALFPELQQRPDNWSSIGAWAWGLHRVLDYLACDGAIDENRVVVMGHSRLGKTALWAGATDPRFAGVISNNSGCGGAALARRRFGESVAKINRSFPHWFCQRHHDFGNRESELPVDQHELIALIAPRPVYIASAQDDRWADPRGEYLSAFHASPVYRLLGAVGLGQADPAWPPVDQPIGERIRYHIRTGPHDVTDFDWQQYLDFADDLVGQAD